ncbi:hypothetical protein SAMN04487948_104128 [Halogranum amylolyticum]|uniref:Uncharacterized protein n=1 Tax=Halogranum amylolyticum TaxID=660520 RepID=A0A1H8RN02_9EURY|nr:hypothetical protein [Halogranum amylolyticum]SEO67745.1 hypothetical protein SAMN04487948_104128 [Halogranum amylolyticum]
MSSTLGVDAVDTDATRGDDASPPRDSNGYHICYRECKDGTPCRRITNVPWLACHVHFDQPPMLLESE